MINCGKTTANITFNLERLNISPQIRNKQGFPLSQIQHYTWGSNNFTETRGKKSIVFKKKVFTDDLIVYVENWHNLLKTSYNEWIGSEKIQDTRSTYKNQLHYFFKQQQNVTWN